MSDNVLRILGVIILALPFVGIFAFASYQVGWQLALLPFVFVAIFIGLIVLGFHLIDR